MEKLMTYKSSMTTPAHYVFLFVLFISMPLVAQEEVKKEDESEVAVVPDADGIEDPGLKAGNVAPSWALMYAPAKFEFLKNWTVERGARLRKSTTQPYRHVVVVSFFATWCKPCMKELPLLQNLYEKFDGQRVKWFLVDITEATRTSPGYEDSPKAAPFLAKKGITMQILNDNRGVAKQRYGAKTLPRLYVIDKFQTIRLAKKGFHEGEDFEGEVGAMVEKLLAEADE